jgi:UDP-glucose 4-epimerase
MRILITGANGYIGKSLHTALKDKYDVTAITRNSFDLTNAVDMFEFFQGRPNFDVVLHCAVAGASNPRSEDWNIMDNNLKIYYNLLQHRNYFTKLIHFGSGAETYLPDTPYGYSKKVIAKSILNQDNFYNLKIFGVFDENELDTRFIKANLTRYINKELMQIHQNKGMDFFYMGDLIKVVDYYINEKDPPKEFDCVYNTILRLDRITTMINELDKHKVNIATLVPEEGVFYTSNYRNIKLPIEFIGLEEGIKNVYNKLKNETN